MWMLSASSARRWSSLSVGVGSFIAVAIKHKSPEAVRPPGFDLFQRSLGCFWFLPKQPDRCRGDHNGPGTTTHAGTTGSRLHETPHSILAHPAKAKNNG